MGARLQVHMSPRSKTYITVPPSAFLVAWPSQRRGCLRSCLRGVCQEQILSSSSCWPPQTPTCSWASLVSYSGGLRHGPPHGQTERANQDLETAIRCITARNPTSWSSFLLWVEYVHNSLTSATTGMTPFTAAYGYQPPLLSAQEGEIAVPLVHKHITQCREVWRAA